MAMPQQPAFAPQQQQQRGTLLPGQTISVNKYTVQVERYLSQGGFAHVYLVRTATPIFHTDQHVLKRIAVPNENMLSEVKKEVDIMRILRGHPNIVYLIDAAWHRMANGMYEVFILMEFCPGGGIIEMMNRRLRERLTEAEIMQIFVDVCEGVAAMHNLRPALLHRDLKVENILQASPTSFKLCDFGSATSVAPRPPSTTQEIRALEADLNRHTTLQYRAPEMVDPYLRRAVDEKSDVWALGVLLYKLCYYTTPFEEHGVLAILNVQYKIPPYPVYSTQMNSLIASMLREHGTQRPNVFEILDLVHMMRGTKSHFTYNPPPRQPLSPRPVTSIPNPMDNIVVYKSSSAPVSAPNNGIKAREKVLEAISPMRRGRRGQSSPTKEKFLNDAFGITDNDNGDAWKLQQATNNNGRAHKSGFVSSSGGDAGRVNKNSPANDFGDAWSVTGAKSEEMIAPDRRSSTFGEGFGDSFDASLLTFRTANTGKAVANPISIPTSENKYWHGTPPTAPDAFESLNMFPSSRTNAPTLGEAQRSGMTGSKLQLSPSRQPLSKLSASPSPGIPTPVSVPTGSTTSESAPAPSRLKVTAPAMKQRSSDQSLSAEKRFPTVEELDSAFTSPLSGYSQLPPHAASQPQLPPRAEPPPERPAQLQSIRSNLTSGGLKPTNATNQGLPLSIPRQDGVRSQQVTGTAMRESRQQARKVASPAVSTESTRDNSLVKPKPDPSPTTPESPIKRSTRPVLSRKHRSSVSIKRTHRSGEGTVDVPGNTATPLAQQPPKDWLTGDDSFNMDNPILRASPEKKTSQLHSPVQVQAAHEAIRSSPSPAKQTKLPSPVRTQQTAAEKEGIALTDNWSPVTIPKRKEYSSDDGEDGPEDANGFTPQAKEMTRRRSRTKGRQSSVHDLVDLWGGGGTNEKPAATKVNRRKSAIVPSMKEPMKEPMKPLMTLPTSSVISDRRSSPKGTSNPTEPIRSPTSRHRKQPSASAADTTPSSSTPRSRPQSMFVFPIQKATSDITPVVASPSLAPPDGHRSKSSARRSSISDIVSRYEAIGVTKTKGVTPPALAAKPARLKVAPAASPTAASVRFPRISPTSLTRPAASSETSLKAPSGASDTPNARKNSRSPTGPPDTPDRRSTSPTRQPQPAGDHKPTPRLELKPLDTFNAPIEPLPQASVTPPEEEPHSPSPERPFQGVSKLIDQWQKKSEEAEGKTRGPGKAGLAARFRRDGIAVGGSKGS